MQQNEHETQIKHKVMQYTIELKHKSIHRVMKRNMKHSKSKLRVMKRNMKHSKSIHRVTLLASKKKPTNEMKWMAKQDERQKEMK